MIENNKVYTLTDFTFRLEDEEFEKLKEDCENWDEMDEQEQENALYSKVEELACEFTSIYGPTNINFFMVDEVQTQ